MTTCVARLTETERHSLELAYKQGLFVLGRSGETVIIRNNADFQPKPW